MCKSEPTKKIEKILSGENDPSGNKIIDVLAKGNEYAIYEIEHHDINNRLRVLIDGITDESEKKLTEKFNKVKQKYIEAKGLLYRSSNFGMMKNRVAHALATSLTAEEINGNNEFDKLIEDIKNENRESITNRIFYLIPCILITMILAVISIWYLELRLGNGPYWQLIIILLSSSLGGSMSIIINVKKLHFEEYSSRWFYLIFGIERLFLSFVAGAIAYTIIKSKLIFPLAVNENYWKVMVILIASAFSETFVPTMLGKIEKKV